MQHRYLGLDEIQKTSALVVIAPMQLWHAPAISRIVARVSERWNESRASVWLQHLVAEPRPGSAHAAA